MLRDGQRTEILLSNIGYRIFAFFNVIIESLEYWLLSILSLAPPYWKQMGGQIRFLLNSWGTKTTLFSNQNAQGQGLFFIIREFTFKEFLIKILIFVCIGYTVIQLILSFIFIMKTQPNILV